MLSNNQARNSIYMLKKIKEIVEVKTLQNKFQI